MGWRISSRILCLRRNSSRWAHNNLMSGSLNKFPSWLLYNKERTKLIASKTGASLLRGGLSRKNHTVLISCKDSLRLILTSIWTRRIASPLIEMRLVREVPTRAEFSECCNLQATHSSTKEPIWQCLGANQRRICFHLTTSHRRHWKAV